jgi:hypothetical protein
MNRLLPLSLLLALALGLAAAEGGFAPDVPPAAPQAAPKPPTMRLTLKDGRVVTGPFDLECMTLHEQGGEIRSFAAGDVGWCEPAGAEYGTTGTAPEIPAGLDKPTEAKAQELKTRVSTRRQGIRQAIKDQGSRSPDRLGSGLKCI